MKWKDLSEEERDRLVAEKVMGWQPGICDGEWGEQPNSPDGWFCLKCGHEGGWGDDFEHEQIPPSYSTSMDVACAIPVHPSFFGANTEIVSVPKGYWNCCVYFHQQNKRHYGFADTPAEAVCIAFLRAAGVEIETSEVQDYGR